MLPIIFFLLSMVFLGSVAWVRKIPFLSTFGIFALFQALYNITPWWLATIQRDSGLVLAGNLDYVDRLLTVDWISNVCFGCIFLWGSTYKKNLVVKNRSYPSLNFFLLSLPVFLVTIAMCVKYGWHAGGAGSLYTVTAYLKFLCCSIFVYYVYRCGMNAWAWGLLFLHVLILAVDNARVSFLPLFIFAIIIYSEGASKTAKRFALGLALFGLIMSAAVRGLAKNRSGLDAVMDPITVEGSLGSYSALQSIYLGDAPDPDHLHGLSYLVDPIAWFLPAGDSRDALSYYSLYVAESGNYLDEDYSPWGGLYYPAEAIANFGMIGVPLVTVAFAFLLLFAEKYKNSHRLYYYLFISTFGFIFVKTIFGLALKLFIVEVAFAWMIRYVESYLRKRSIRNLDRPLMPFRHMRPTPARQRLGVDARTNPLGR